MTRLHRLHLHAGLLLALAACGGGNDLKPLDFRGSAAPEIAIFVDNFNFNEVTVYALGDGQRRRLGVVTGKQSRGFRVPWHFQNIRFQVSVLAGPTFTTHEVLVNPGDRLDLVIRANLRATEVRRSG